MRIIALVAAMMLPAMAVAEPGDAGLQTSAPTQEEAIISSGADAAFRMTVPVMVNGQVIASDTPAAVRADAGVQAAYLGEEH